MTKVNIKDSSIQRDIHSKALLMTDRRAFDDFKKKKSEEHHKYLMEQEIKLLKDEVKSIKTSINEILRLLNESTRN